MVMLGKNKTHHVPLLLGIALRLGPARQVFAKLALRRLRYFHRGQLHGEFLRERNNTSRDRPVFLLNRAFLDLLVKIIWPLVKLPIQERPGFLVKPGPGWAGGDYRSSCRSFSKSRSRAASHFSSVS